MSPLALSAGDEAQRKVGRQLSACVPAAVVSALAGIGHHGLLK